jgi:hypothetical protein
MIRLVVDWTKIKDSDIISVYPVKDLPAQVFCESSMSGPNLAEHDK